MADESQVEPEAPQRAWRMIVMGVLTIAASSLLSIVCAEFFGFSVAMFLAVTLGIVSMFWIFEKGELSGALMFLAIFAVAASGLFTCAMQSCQRIGSETAPIPVGDAAKHAGALVFQFSDGVVKEELAGRQDIRGRTGVVNVAWVAPIVPENWTRETPVTLWAAGLAEGDGYPKANWKLKPTAGVSVGGTFVEDFQKASRYSCRAFKLNQIDNAPIVWLSPTPAQTYWNDWIQQAYVIGGCGIFWIATVGVHALIRFFKRRR